MTDDEYKAIRLAAIRGIVGVGGDQETCELVLGPLDRARAAEMELREKLARMSETACGYLEDLQTVSRERDEAVQYRAGMLDLVRTANEDRDTARAQLAALTEALQPFAEAQTMADLCAARGETNPSCDPTLACNHVRPSAFRVAARTLLALTPLEARREGEG